MSHNMARQGVRSRRYGVLGRMMIGVMSLMVGGVVVAQQPAVAAHVQVGESADELLARRVTIRLVNVSLARALDSISRVANVTVEYQLPLLIAYPKPITLNVTALPLGALLEQLLSATALRVVPGGPGSLTIVESLETRADSVPLGTVSGRIVDSATGHTIPGATVKVVGTKLTIVTSDSGRFVLRNVPVGNALLTVRAFGYRPTDRTVTVTDVTPATVRIPLAAAPNVLSGVVTTATGQRRKIEVGNDITVLNADSIQRIAPVSTLTQMLETRVPGLIVQHTSGIPGAPSRLRLRGLSSINMSADPILIVDGIRVYADQSGSVQDPVQHGNGSHSGIPMTEGGSSINSGGPGSTSFAGPSALDQLDPNSIETLEVLKGPSATAIYGSDAANGVIVVTTKHGQPGPTRWTLSLEQGRTTLPGSWPVNYFLFGHSPRWDGATQSELCGLFTECLQDSVVAFQALNDPRYSPLTGEAGHDRNASLTVSGGSGTLTYSVTGSASTQSGYLHLPPIELARFQLFHGFPAPNWMRTPDQYTTEAATSTLNVQLGQGGGTLALTSSLFRGAQQQSSLQTDLQNLSIMYVDTSQLAAHPLFSDYYTRAQLNTTTFTNAVSLDNWAPWRWLPLTATGGLSVQDEDNTTLLPRDYISCMLGSGVDNGNCAVDSLGKFAISQGTNTSGSFMVGTTLARQRLMSTAVGLNVYTLAQSGFSANTIGLPIGVSVPTIFVPDNGGSTSYSTVNQTTYGWYVQPTVNLNSRFFVSPGFRLDGGSNSGTHSGVNGGALSLFPKLDFSWIAVERSPSEPLFGALTLLRPRIALGIAGVQPGPGQQLRLLQSSQVTLPSLTGTTAPVDILQLETLGNTQLHPERDRELEGGFDAEFWNQRLSLTLTGYQKTAYDALLAIPVAASVLTPGMQGTGSITTNIGTIRNTGIEATLFARVLDSRHVDWSVNANLAQNRNRLVSLAPGVLPIQIQDGGGGTRLEPGYPLFGLWAPPIVEFNDANHNGLIEPSEIRVGDSAVYVGAPQPNYELTVSTTLALFNDRLSVNTALDYQNGLTQFMTGNISRDLMNPSLSAAQQAAIVAGTQGLSTIGLLQTVNTLRWNTVSVTYLAPSSLTHLVHVPMLSFALQGSNLALHTNYRGKDPNVNTVTSGNLTQDTGGLLPQPRIWNLRVTVGY